ncbi:hypothetical protein [Antarcticimicrobium luteum]|uniref:Uncharacterized protein n=1 Tax=Antarcticimicrobium luteum TaxID=2547397 RepID=A0A4R5VIX3_9RHOB|nr:hypothetical protein [Antarcticimicrobium luteum]TDK53681.1 hypothetical protein E1832_00425 [Antarcticimicrobium luteum]
MPFDFSDEQIRFLAKYLSPLEARIQKWKLFRKKSTRLNNNQEIAAAIETLKSDFSEWLVARDEVLAKIEAIGIRYDLTKVPEQKDKCETLKRRHLEIVTLVRAAPEDAPVFEQGTTDMRTLGNLVDALAGEVGEAIAALAPPATTEVFDEALAGVDRIAEFRDHPTLSPSIANKRLADDGADAKRATALQEHTRLCGAARVQITGLRDRFVAVGQGADLEKQARIAVMDLGAALEPVHAALSAAVSTAATAALEEMEQGGDEVAARELARSDRLKADAERLDGALVKIDEKIDGLRQEVEGAEGFQEKRALLAQIAAETERRDALEERARQMDAYRASAAQRVEKMLAAEALQAAAQERVAEVDPDGDDLDTKLAEWSGQRPDGAKAIVPLDPDGDLSGKELQREQEVILANIVYLKTAVERSAAKIVVDAKLYPDEADLTEISAPQKVSLLKMLTLAESLCDKGKHAEARALHADVQSLWRSFIDARSFVLPDLPEDGPDLGKRVERSVKQLSAAIERLWGMGGDDGPFRDRLDAIKRAAETAGTQEAPDYRPILADIDAMERDLALALRQAAQLSPEDEQSKEQAAKTASKIATALLSLYRTEVISEGDVAGVHPNDLLVVLKDDGRKEYHRIRLRDDETVQRREDKSIPREAIDALRQQMQMLDQMAASDTAGSAEAVAAAAKKADEMRAAIAEGGDDYKRVTTALQAFDKKMADKKLQEWRMNGTEPLTARKEKFASGYAASMLPADAANEAEQLLSEAETLIAATGPLKEKYGTVKVRLDGIENKLSAKPKGDDPTLGKVLADLIKNGPAAVSTGPLSIPEMAEVQRLQKEIVAALDKIKALGQHGTGVQGAFRKSLGEVRKTLETKSEQGVLKAEQDAATLEQQVDAELARVQVRPSVDPMAYLRQIAALTKGAAKACEDKDAAQTRAGELRETAKTELAAAKTALDGATRLASKVEYKAVYDSLESQYKSADKAWNNGKGDAEATISAFEPVISNAKELAADLGQLTTVRTGGERVDLDGFETALKVNMGKVAEAALAAGTVMTTLAAQSEEQTGDDDLDAAMTKVRTILGEVGGLANVIAFPPGLQVGIDMVLAETDPAKKKADMAILREKVLSEIRKIANRIEEDPALEVYRDNPFDHGGSWPQFRATLLALETQVLKSLNPGR